MKLQRSLIKRQSKKKLHMLLCHLQLLFPPETLTVEKILQLAIDGETYEYTEMYPEFRNTALEERNTAAAAEMDE